MSIRLEMLQAARLAPKALGDSTELVRSFLLRQLNPDGGFKNRAGTSDLYYTVFGLDGLLALQTELPIQSVRSFLNGFGTGEGLDFVHLCCLARCWATTGGLQLLEERQALWERIEAFRAPEGGYNQVMNSALGTAYGCFLALAASQDLNLRMRNPEGMLDCLARLQTADGAWTNTPPFQTPLPAPPSPAGSTLATAAALAVLRQLNQPIGSSPAGWLLARCHPQGGFLATPTAPIPDLLSTATALHALAGLGASCGHLKERCLDFVDSLWTNAGAFHGHWAEDHLDTEYTFYGLLALGHLSLQHDLSGQTPRSRQVAGDWAVAVTPGEGYFSPDGVANLMRALERMLAAHKDIPSALQWHEIWVRAAQENNFNYIVKPR